MLENIKNDVANEVTKEIYDAILFEVHSLVKDWVLELGFLFHTKSHQEII